MIRLIEALNFRCLRYIRQPLEQFHVLVGPNASGKTTFLDVVAFLGSLVSDGLVETTVSERTQNFHDLVWGRSGDRFELAIEAAIPEDLTGKIKGREYDTARYAVAIGIDPDSHEVGILTEKVTLFKAPPALQPERRLFPEEAQPPDTILTPQRVKGRTVVTKVQGGNDTFSPEVSPVRGKKGWIPSFKLGPRKSALANLPADESKFPISTWLRSLLTDGVQRFILNSLLIRKASPPGQGIRRLRPDGSNLPWIIAAFREGDPGRHREWVLHLKTALPELADITTVERPDDRHRYLVLHYKDGLEVPSWMASDGTLRLLALTLPAYLPDVRGVYLIEEPENGVHPKAVETMFQSLRSVYDAQILLATHSPVVLSAADPDSVLCFAKTPDGATDIVTGREHPALREWHGQTNLGVLFAGGVLG